MRYFKVKQNYKEILSVVTNIVVNIIGIGILKHIDKAEKQFILLSLETKIFSVREQNTKVKSKKSISCSFEFESEVI